MTSGIQRYYDCALIQYWWGRVGEQSYHSSIQIKNHKAKHNFSIGKYVYRHLKVKFIEVLFTCSKFNPVQLSFDKHVQMCNPHHNQDITWIHHSQTVPSSPSFQSTLPPALTISDLFSVPIVFSCPESHINGIMRYVTFLLKRALLR